MDETINWLLKGPPWVVYRTRLDLLGQSKNNAEVIKARQDLHTHPRMESLLNILDNWPGTVLNNHKNANHPLHLLSFVADLGFTADSPHFDNILGKIMAHQTAEGPFQILMNIPESFGGSGRDQWAWALCDAPVILYALVKMGLGDDAGIQKGIAYLVGLIRDNGWPCVVDRELGKFRGPGRKDDPCPYATLIMLKLLSQTEKWRNSRETHIGAEALLNLWVNSKILHPYMFYMGTDFRKLKAPFVWYDILHLLDVLSQFDWLKNDLRLMEMAGLLKEKADQHGLFTPESVYKAWNEWDFGQKKSPSPWLTFLALRILKRLSD